MYIGPEFGPSSPSLALNWLGVESAGWALAIGTGSPRAEGSQAAAAAAALAGAALVGVTLGRAMPPRRLTPRLSLFGLQQGLELWPSGPVAARRCAGRCSSYSLRGVRMQLPLFFQDQDQQGSYFSFLLSALAATAPFTFCRSSSAGGSRRSKRQKMFQSKVQSFQDTSVSVKPSCPPQAEKGLVLWSGSALCDITPGGTGRAMTVS